MLKAKGKGERSSSTTTTLTINPNCKKTMANKTSDDHCKKKSSASVYSNRPYNHYNLFFILERELLLQSRGNETQEKIDSLHSCGSLQGQGDDVNIINNYSDLKIPPLPPRYQNLILRKDWFVHGNRNRNKRRHVKSHGIASFTDLSRIIALTWSEIDDETFQYLITVASLVKERLQKGKAAREFCSAAASEIVCGASLSPTTMACQPVADESANNALEHDCSYLISPTTTILCQPADDSQIFPPALPFWNSASNLMQQQDSSVSSPPVAVTAPARVQSQVANSRSITEVEMIDNVIVSFWKST